MLRLAPSAAPVHSAPPRDPRGARDTDANRAESTPHPKHAEPNEASGAAPEETSKVAPTAQLPPEDLRLLDELRNRDREVRSHEQAHKRAAGQYAGPIHYEYKNGPDNKRYAVGGHVQVDLSPVPGNPKATIKKMQQLYRAALAPLRPSSADFAAAQQAKQNEAEARMEMVSEHPGDKRNDHSEESSFEAVI